MAYKIRTGISCDLPERYGRWQTAHARFRRYAAVGLPDGFPSTTCVPPATRFRPARAGHSQDTMVRVGRSSEKATLTYQHSDEERQREVAAQDPGEEAAES